MPEIRNMKRETAPGVAGLDPAWSLAGTGR